MSKPNTKSFQKLDSQGWLLQASHSTAKFALDLWTHSLFPCLVCARSCAVETTQIFLLSSYSQIGWKKQTCKHTVMVQKLQTGTNLPEDTFCLRIYFYFSYQNF